MLIRIQVEPLLKRQRKEQNDTKLKNAEANILMNIETVILISSNVTSNNLEQITLIKYKCHQI